MAKKKPKYMFVWRLEDAEGDGIYRGGYDKLNTNYVRHCTDLDNWVSSFETRHPTPWNDAGLREFLRRKDFFDDYHFGFATIGQYKAWFFKAKWRRAFSESGVRLNKYKVQVRYGKRGSKQAMFRKDKAKLVETRCPAYSD